tara:strand:+ start:166 stop:615 length:450 start_codon:yes stop_codon:yes gene_type:complete
MFAYILLTILLIIFILYLLIKLSNLPQKNFLKISKYFFITLFLILFLFLIRFNPAIISSIPALIILFFKWRPLLIFLRNTFFSKRKENFNSSNLMTKDEALSILGLKEGATKKEILKSYHDLMKKNHPDHGGSDWITARLNKAKETLLG